MAMLFLLIFTTSSIVFFSLGNPVAGGVMLGIPVLAVIRTMWTPTIGQRHDRQEQTEGRSG